MPLPGPSSSSTGSEITNYARIGHAAQQLLPDILQELFAIKEPQHRLHTDVSNNRFLTRNLRADEWIMINNARTNGYADFDIPLIYKLVRNLNLIPAPTQGWDSQPTQIEITPGDDLERIRRTRNIILHRGNSKVTDQELTDFFCLFKDISARLETYLGKVNGEFVGRFEDLETRCMDEETEERYLTRLKNLKIKDDELSKVVDELRKDVDSLMNKDFHQVVIEDWENQNRLFVNTDASEYVLKSLKDSHIFTVTGSSGIGKSATVHHIALLLRDTEGYNIIPCHSPLDIETYYKKNKQLLFVFDDVCGKYTIVQTYVENWIKRSKYIQNILEKGEVKLLATCRLQVFQEEQFQRVEILSKMFCDLSSPKFLLSDPMKLKIAYQYLTEDDVELIKNHFNEFEFIPLMFELYKSSRTAGQLTDALYFFKNPFDVYTSEMDALRLAPDKTKYCALFLLVLHNGIIEACIFSTKETRDARNRRLDIFEECGIPRNTVRKRIEEQLKSLSSLFVKSLGKTYTTIHDKVFEFLCFYFGKHLQRTFIRHADSKLIRERTQLKSIGEAKGEFLIGVEEANEEDYFERVILDISIGRSEDVFNHKHMLHNEYRAKFIHAMTNINGERVKRLPSTEQFEETVLAQACLHDFYDIVKYSVDRGTDVNAASFYDYTIPFNWEHSTLFAMQCLLYQLKICNKVPIDKLGASPLMIACYRGNAEIVKLLLDNGADVNAESSAGNTPLLIACYQNCINIVQMLLEAGAYLNYTRHDGLTPLVACAGNMHFRLAEILVEIGADVNPSFRNCNLPLVLSCYYDIPTLIKLLIDKGATDINTVYFVTGYTPLHGVCGDNNTEMLYLLLDKGANVNATTFIGETPLIIACRASNFEFVQILLDKGADVNIARHDGETPLMTACGENSLKCARLLLENGADVNAVMEDGTPALIFACYSGTSDIVKLLLDSGADANVECYDGRTPLTAACHSGIRENVKLIIEKRAGIRIP